MYLSMKATEEDSRGPLVLVPVQHEHTCDCAFQDSPRTRSSSPDSLVAAERHLVAFENSALAACRYLTSRRSAPVLQEINPLNSKPPAGSSAAADRQAEPNCLQSGRCIKTVSMHPDGSCSETRRQRWRDTTATQPAATETATRSRNLETAGKACRVFSCSTRHTDASEEVAGRSLPSESGRLGFAAVPSHLLAFILSLVGDQSAEKAAVSHVCRRWREAAGRYYMWRSVDASHRPLSSLSASVRLSGHLRNLWHRTETLILADDNTAEATELLLQLANASCSSGTRISRSSKRFSSVSCRCRAGSSSRCRSSKRGNSISNNRNCGKSEAEEAPGARSWTLPCLRHLRIYSSMGGGYIRHSIPQDVLAEADAARRPCGLASLHAGDGYRRNSSSCSRSGLQHLEELVLDTVVGPELLLALRGKTPRLKTLIISRLSEKPNSSYQARYELAGVSASGGEEPAEEHVSALEALLLLLEELPPQQLAVFGFGKGLELSGGGFGAGSKSIGNSNNSACKFPEGLSGLRARLRGRGREGDKEEAIGDELCSLLASKHQESLRALWMPDICTSLEAAGDLLSRCRNLNVCSIPGASVLHQLQCMLGSGRPVCGSSPAS